MSIRSFQRAHARRLARAERHLTRRGSLVAGLAVSGTLLLAPTALANTYQVTTSGDSSSTSACNAPAPPSTSYTCANLRDAVAAANADTTANSPNTITFAPSVTGIIHFVGTLDITGPNALTITGPGANALAISGNDTIQDVQDVYITSPGGTPVTITGLTLTDGNSGTAPGGAIRTTNPVDLSLSNDTIENSTTGTGSSTYDGGGIYSDGPLTLDNSTVSGNTASGEGGGLYSKGTLAVTDSTVSDNHALGGGGLYARSPATIQGSTISGNVTTANAGGGMFVYGNLSVSSSTLSNNQAAPQSGVGGGIMHGQGSLTMTADTVTGNQALNGGGIYLARVDGSPGADQTISNTLVSGNTAVAPSTPGSILSGAGGGIAIDTPSGSFNREDYAPIHIDASTISGNQGQYGAGLYLRYLNPANPFTLSGSTLSDNTGGSGSFGGGMLVGEVYGQAKVIDSTLTGNTAAIGAGVSLGRGAEDFFNGGSGKYGSGQMTFANSTIALNSASEHAGGIYLGQYKRYSGSSSSYVTGTASLFSTVVGSNSAQGHGDDLEQGGAATTGGFNAAFSLIESPGTAKLLNPKDVITGIGPQLGPLANNGGSTETMLPSGTSPVIDQGHASPGQTTDQIGNPRTVDTAIANPVGGDGTDIGAVELPASSVVIPTPTPTPTAGTTLSIHGASLSLSSRPLLVGDQTPLTCSVRTGLLNACAIQVRVGSKVIGQGEVISTRGAQSLIARVTATKAGLTYLKSRPLGVDAVASLVASQTAPGSDTVSGNVHFLASPSITLGLGARSSKLSSGVVTELGRVAKLLAGAKSYTCTAYTSPGQNSVSLTKTIAGSACARLKRDGLKGRSRSVGKGTAGAIASNKTKKGQAANRRLSISFTF